MLATRQFAPAAPTPAQGAARHNAIVADMRAYEAERNRRIAIAREQGRTPEPFWYADWQREQVVEERDDGASDFYFAGPYGFGRGGAVISFETARDIAYAYREVETGEKLLAELAEAKGWHKPPDVRDAFGRRQDGLQLGVPSGDSSRRMYHVAWELAVPIVEAHVAASRAKIVALCVKARAELDEVQS